MSGDKLREEAVLAAVKPLKTENSATRTGNSTDFTLGSGSAGRTSTSLEGLFEQHHVRVFRTAHRVTGNAADAEDVLQTVFLRLARGAERPDISENPEGYFSRAAVNASLDLIRIRKRSRVVAIEDIEERGPIAVLSSGGNPETHQADSELRELIRAAVSRLSPSAAQMFALRYFEGHSNNDIAVMMETSALVVGVTLHRARARLRKEIGVYLRGKNA